MDGQFNNHKILKKENLMKKIICNVLAVVCGVCALTSLTACKGGDYNADNFLTFL